MNRRFTLGAAALAAFLAAAGCSSKEGIEKAKAAPAGKPAVSVDAANAATGEEAALIERFAKEAALTSVERKLEREDGVWSSVTRPIYMERACLSCHGDRDKRPDFIIKKYPEDRAYGFKDGDLRGIITVTAPLGAEGQ